MSTEAAIKPESLARSLYERDPYSWALEQARALRERRTAMPDWDNLAEEVEDLAGRHADSLKSYCRVLVEQLLKLAYASGQIRKWQSPPLDEQRQERPDSIKDLLAINPV
jgi:hypothetical protein